MNAALNGTRRALRLGTGLATCVSCMVFAQTAFGQAVELPNVANANGAMIGTSLTSPTMTVNADGANRVIDWNTFSIGATGVVDFVSRNTMTNVTDTTTPLTVVNRVIGTSNGLGAPRTFTPSLINGKITSTANIAVCHGIADDIRLSGFYFIPVVGKKCRSLSFIVCRLCKYCLQVLQNE